MKFDIRQFKITDYLVTPRDIYHGVLYVVQRITVRDTVGALLVVGLFAVLQFVFDVSGDGLFFWPFIAVIIYWNLDARVAFGLALATLVLIPFLLILFNQEIMLTGEFWAERVAVWTYSFLVIGTLKQIVEYLVENKTKKNQPPAGPAATVKPAAKQPVKKISLDIVPPQRKYLKK